MTRLPHRRQMLKTLGALSLSPLAIQQLRADDGQPSEASGKPRKFTLDLTPGMIGVQAPFPKIVELAAENGFESVAPDAGYLAGLSVDELESLRAGMKDKGLVWGAAGLPVDFRGAEEGYQGGMKDLDVFASTLERAGVTRVGTWLRPSHDSLSYLSNFRQHARRLREIATVLGDHGLRFGLEYVGPKLSWTAARYPFIHTMVETRELIEAIDRDNVGLVLDSWHWYTAGEVESDLLSLSNRDVVACDLNDAPVGVMVELQIDNKRELPLATGVIDLKTFLNALVAIGYDGPVRAEPFKAELRELPAEEAVAATARSMKAAFALLD